MMGDVLPTRTGPLTLTGVAALAAIIVGFDATIVTSETLAVGLS